MSRYNRLNKLSTLRVTKKLGDDTPLLFIPMVSDDPNLPSRNDEKREAFEACAIFDRQSSEDGGGSRYKSASGHEFTKQVVRDPYVVVSRCLLDWMPQPRDRIRRGDDGTLWEVHSSQPDGMGEVCIKLTQIGRVK